MQKSTFTRQFLWPILISIGALILARLIFLSLATTISEPEMRSFQFTQWAVFAGILIIISLLLLSNIFDIILPWKKYAGTRFVFQMLLGTFLALSSINLVYRFIRDESNQAPADWSQIVLLNIYGAALILPLFSFYFGYKFLKDWRKSEVESARLSKENARSQLMSLRNHLDPHFLFNNLNILSSLMDKNTELSKEYLNKFAEVYRVILKTEYSDLTILEDELKLIESYIYLIKIRFEDCVFFEINISEEDYKKALPPLTLQMLIENAIKHNVATKEQPITIGIKSDAGFLLVENNMQKKKYLPRERKATGILNIRKRYEFFSDKTMEVVESEEKFIVKLPLIEIEYAD